MVGWFTGRCCVPLTWGRSTQIEGRGRGRIEKDRWMGRNPDQWVLTQIGMHYARTEGVLDELRITRAPGNRAPLRDCRRPSFRHLPLACRRPTVELSTVVCGLSHPTFV